MEQIINDLFEKHQVRKSKKQKTAFIEYTRQRATELGWESRVERGALGVRNIVVGDPEKAKVIYTAHYDTCAVLPFPNFLTPKSVGLYLLYNLAVVIPIFILMFALFFVSALLEYRFGLNTWLCFALRLVVVFAICDLMIFGPANKHTANDNTSGVAVLFGIMKSLPAEQRESVALVFFDLEEAGMIGSSAFAGKHKEIKNGKLLINYDCVSDGRDLMVLVKKAAAPYRDKLSESFVTNEAMDVDITDKALYPSDQMQFKCGVGVAAFKKTRGGMLYMNKIHTPKDTVFRRENIDFLVESSIKLAERL